MSEEKDARELSQAEWNIMESLWDGAPKIGSHIVADLKESVGWSRSTTLTMLRRMSAKGTIGFREIKGVRAYFPLVERDAAVRSASDRFLEMVYHGNIGCMVKHYVEEGDLSLEQLSELFDIFEQAASQAVKKAR